MSKRKKRCEHKTVIHEWQENIVGPITKRCSPTFGCGALLDLGPANDDSVDVQREIRAAEIAACMKSFEHARMNNAEWDGFDDVGDSPFADIVGWHIGWLAAEATHDHSDGWAWDVSRPIAGQFEALPYNVRTGTTRHTVPVPLAEKMAETERVDAEADGLIDMLGLDPTSDDPTTAMADHEANRSGYEVVAASHIAGFSAADPMTCSIVLGDFNGRHGDDPDPAKKFSELARQVAVPVEVPSSARDEDNHTPTCAVESIGGNVCICEGARDENILPDEVAS
jgi:hypothetical protein